RSEWTRTTSEQKTLPDTKTKARLFGAGRFEYRAAIFLGYATLLCLCSASAKSFTISRLKAGMSSGFLLLTQLRSRSTSRSSHLAPLLLISSLKVRQLVMVWPLVSPAETSSHAP